MERSFLIKAHEIIYIFKLTRWLKELLTNLYFFVPQIHRTDTYPTVDNEPPWISTDDGRVALTAYFRDPGEICFCKGKRKTRVPKKPPIGDRLWFQMSDFWKEKNFMVIPLNTNQIAGTLWVKGPCITAMGKVLGG